MSSTEEDVLSMPLPNPEAGARFKQAMTELWCNTPLPELDGRTPWQAAQQPDGLERVEARFPVPRGTDPELIAQRRQALQPLPPATERWEQAFSCSGGLLNLFTDRPLPKDDDDWRRLEKTHHGDREAAAREWNALPSLLFAELSPAQVVAGGGPQEAELLEDLAAFVLRALEGEKSFPSPGELSRAFLLALRNWQGMPQQALGGRRPAQVIREEREAVLQDKLART